MQLQDGTTAIQAPICVHLLRPLARHILKSGRRGQNDGTDRFTRTPCACRLVHSERLGIVRRSGPWKLDSASRAVDLRLLETIFQFYGLPTLGALGGNHVAPAGSAEDVSSSLSSLCSHVQARDAEGQRVPLRRLQSDSPH